MTLNIEWKLEEMDNETLNFSSIEKIFHYTIKELNIENWKTDNVHGSIYLASENDIIKIWFKIN